MNPLLKTFMPQPNLSSQSNKLKLYLGSTVLFALTCLLVLVFAPLVLISAILPFSFRYFLAKTWAKSVIKLAEGLCGIRFQVDGLEHLQMGTAAVVLSNHQSAWETIAFRCFLPMQTALFKKSLLYIPLWGWAMMALKPIAIDRSSKQAALRKLIKQGTEALQEGLWIIVFPEGTRCPIGKTGEFNAGGAMLAQKSGYPVIPIAHDAGKCWPRYSFLKFPGTIRVKIGPPIATKGRKASDINQEAEQWIVNALAELYQ